MNDYRDEIKKDQKLNRLEKENRRLKDEVKRLKDQIEELQKEPDWMGETGQDDGTVRASLVAYLNQNAQFIPIKTVHLLVECKVITKTQGIVLNTMQKIQYWNAQGRNCYESYEDLGKPFGKNRDSTKHAIQDRGKFLDRKRVGLLGEHKKVKWKWVVKEGWEP